MKIQNDAVVTLTYRILDSAGDLFEEADGDDPIQYLHGHGELPSGVEEALEGGAAGTELTVELDADSGFGPHDPELIIGVPRAELGEDTEVQLGDLVPVEIATDEGEVTGEVELRVVEVRPDTVFLDGNHPLAGQSLTFSAEVLDVRAATAEELEEAAHTCDNPDHDH